MINVKGSIMKTYRCNTCLSIWNGLKNQCPNCNAQEGTDTLSSEKSIAFRMIQSGESIWIESKSFRHFSSVLWQEKPSKDILYDEISKQIDQWLEE